MSKPWLKNYDPGMTESLPYPEKTLYEMLMRSAHTFPKEVALAFEGTHISFAQLLSMVDEAAISLQKCGVKKGEVATICLPNMPQAVIFLYAVNKIGAIANMVHPKTPAKELCEFISSTNSTTILIFDAFLAKSLSMLKMVGMRNIVVASIGDYLSLAKRIGFYISKGRKIPRLPKLAELVTWKEFMLLGKTAKENQIDSPYISPIRAADPAIYLHSGGTTGLPKTIVLSSHNMNVLAVQGAQIVNVKDPFVTGDPVQMSMVTILPLFHGFGLCMGLHTMICTGICAILVPQFTPDCLAKVILRERPTFMAAVPTLYEGLLKSTHLEKADLSCIKCCFCGGDSLTEDLKTRFEEFLGARGAKITLREGYGLTEVVTVCCVNPEYRSKNNSVGLPLPDMLMKIVKPNTQEELPPLEHGEICVSGPTMMLEYLGDPEATEQAIHRHADNRQWVHTGDFGYMDHDGYFFFLQRLKRIVKVSGVPVFPTQIEGVIAGVEGVRSACAIAVPDSYRIHVIKAFVVLDKDEQEEELVKEAIMRACSENLIAYARPIYIEFRKELPLTTVGKIDYTSLEKEESERSLAALS